MIQSVGPIVACFRSKCVNIDFGLLEFSFWPSRILILAFSPARRSGAARTARRSLLADRAQPGWARRSLLADRAQPGWARRPGAARVGSPFPARRPGAARVGSPFPARRPGAARVDSPFPARRPGAARVDSPIDNPQDSCYSGPGVWQVDCQNGSLLYVCLHIGYPEPAPLAAQDCIAKYR